MCFQNFAKIPRLNKAILEIFTGRKYDLSSGTYDFMQKYFVYLRNESDYIAVHYVLHIKFIP